MLFLDWEARSRTSLQMSKCGGTGEGHEQESTHKWMHAKANPNVLQLETHQKKVQQGFENIVRPICLMSCSKRVLSLVVSC